MLFTVVDSRYQIPSGSTSRVYLVVDAWDDWFSFRTAFYLIAFDENSGRFDCGSVKIGQLGLLPSRTIAPGARAPEIPREFDLLDERFFSLGQDETYYETLNQLPEHFRRTILMGLRDCAFDISLFEMAEEEQVMQTSLLRGVTVANLRNRLNRLAQGDARLTEFWFEYAFPSASEEISPPLLTFHVQPNSEPPTNVHVLIGRNGVGKTRCMQQIVRCLLHIESDDHGSGELRSIGENRGEWSFAGVISVSFSAFDDFVLPEIEQTDVQFTAVGLRQQNPSDSNVPLVKTPQQLASDFVQSFERCREGLRSERWRSAIATLGNDPLFAESECTSLLEMSDEDWKPNAAHLFSRLSSGHAIVLLTITRLVELVDERTLVLLDEPEGHLHPPLLSAFVRSLASLLVRRNGIAIIATHSPVVLQEVPRTCVWILRRTGISSIAEQPDIETFGENVGTLTREVFGLEVTSAGFHELLRKAVYEEALSYEEVLGRFGGQLGAEARAIARGLVADRDSESLV